MDTAIYWVGYVLRHSGARHMRSAAVDLECYQYLLLDVISVLFLSVAALIVISYLMIKKLFSLCVSSKANEKKSKTKTKTS